MWWSGTWNLREVPAKTTFKFLVISKSILRFRFLKGSGKKVWMASLKYSYNPIDCVQSNFVFHVYLFRPQGQTAMDKTYPELSPVHEFKNWRGKIGCHVSGLYWRIQVLKIDASEVLLEPNVSCTCTCKYVVIKCIASETFFTLLSHHSHDAWVLLNFWPVS